MGRKNKSVKKRTAKSKPILGDQEPKKRSTEIDKAEENSYAVFNVGKERFALNLDCVKEILHNFEIYTVPHLPKLFSGVVKLRGESIPVVELRTLLKENGDKAEMKPCLITKIGDSTMGFLVDSDVSIITAEKENIYSLPDCFTREEIEFLDGILWTDNTFAGVLKPREMIEILAQWRQNNEKI